VLSRGSPFASWASGYDDSALQSLLYEPVHGAVIEQLRRHAPSAGHLLDVGCGTGRLLETTAQQYPLVVGLDPCLEMLEAARWRTAPLERGLVCARAERLPFRTGAFDVVTSTLSLRHWHDPALGLRELARVLSGAGTLVIADAPPHPARRPGRRRWRRQTSAFGHLRRMAARCGLTVVDERVAPSLFTVDVITARHR
jgi:ubiquinone/menaquinone biosynthesis C-methylase UbiE